MPYNKSIGAAWATVVLCATSCRSSQQVVHTAQAQHQQERQTVRRSDTITIMRQSDTVVVVRHSLTTMHDTLTLTDTLTVHDTVLTHVHTAQPLQPTSAPHRSPSHTVLTVAAILLETILLITAIRLLRSRCGQPR